MAREKLSILLSLTENTTEFHRTFVDLLSQMHLLTNKWLIKANLIKVLQHSDAFLHLFYNITPQTKLELDQLMEDMFLITWEEEIAAYDALYEDPQKDIWTSYLRHMIITFPKLLSTQAKNEESIIIEWIVDEWENEEYGYNMPLTLILEPFTSKEYWDTIVEADQDISCKLKYDPNRFPSSINVAIKKMRNYCTPLEQLEIEFNMNNTTWERLITALNLKYIDKNTLCDFFLVVSGLYSFTNGVHNDENGIRRYHCGEAGAEMLLAFIQNKVSQQGM
jgi:hypothetical protein